jgi:hypothetical protein
MMEEATRLDAAVGLLTRPSKHLLVDPETREGRWVIADPMLLQLSMAIRNSGGATAFKSSSGTPLPVSAQALDLFREIEATAAERWWSLHHLHFGQGRETLVGRIRTWAAVVRSNEAMTHEAMVIIEGWVRDIGALLQPLRRWEIRGACPTCKEARIQKVQEGETVSSPVLSLVYTADGLPDAVRCASCGAEWIGPASIAGLAYKLNGVM